MRRLLNKIALVAVAAVGVVSCTETNINDNIKINNEPLTLFATTPKGAPATKVDFVDKGAEGIALSWSEGDSFTLYDSEGVKVDDFTTTRGNGNFSSSIDGLTLTEGAVYTAKYNEEVDLANQNGDAITSLDEACQMETTFIYKADEPIAFEHKMAIMTFKFKSASRPAKLVFENGDEVYTVNYASIEPQDGLYTSHIMINPCEAHDRALTFSLYADGESDPYDVRKVASTTIACLKGYRYTSPVSDLDNIIWAGTGTADNPYIIENATQLRQLSDNVINGGKTYEGKYLKQANDIDLKDIPFTPIGSGNIFRGSFDGAGYTISGLNVESDASIQGLFGSVIDGEIKGVNVVGSVSGKSRVGGVAGEIYRTSMTYCSANVTVTGTSNIVGGVVGYASDADIAYCYNLGDVNGSKQTGGVAGYAGRSTLVSCYNRGNVSAPAGVVGGLVGEMYIYDSSLPNAIIACYNTGDVKGENNSNESVGGLIGTFFSRNEESNKPTNIKMCYSAGDNLVADNRTNRGAIFGNATGYMLSESVFFRDDLCSKGGSGNNNTQLKGAFVATPEDYMKSAEFVTRLNNAAFEYNEANKDATQLCAWESVADGYPILNFEKSPEYNEIKSGLVYDEATDTYEISTAANLREFATMVNLFDNEVNGRLTADINLANVKFAPIGNKSAMFKGTFDGARHTISGLNVNSDYDYLGLFSYISGATVKSLYVNGSVTGGRYVGGIVGYADNGSAIVECVSNVTVTESGSDQAFYGGVGGVVGYVDNGSDVVSCGNLGAVNKGNDTSKAKIGGIVGSIYDSNLVSCYNRGAISGGKGSIGGIAGYIYGSSCQILYSAAPVTFCGSPSLSDVGAIAGNYYSKKLTNAYFNSDLCEEDGVDAGNNYTQKYTTEKMQNNEEFLSTFNFYSKDYNDSNPKEIQLCGWKVGDDGYIVHDYDLEL